MISVKSASFSIFNKSFVNINSRNIRAHTRSAIFIDYDEACILL